MKPIDLKELYGNSYKIELDEAATCQDESRSNPSYYQIPCKFGHFYPHSDKLIGLYCKGQKLRARLHRDHSKLEVRQWSDDGEAVFLFTTNQFDLVASYAQPKRKRQLSPDHQQKLTESGRDHQYSKKFHGSNGHSERHHGHFTENER